MTPIQINIANDADIDEIIQICESNLISNKINHDKNTIEQSGFLLKKFEKEELKTLINHPDYLILTAKTDEEILGYIIACSFDFAEPNSFPEISLMPELQNTNQQKILYYKQIAKKPGTKNIGSALLQNLITHAQNKNYHSIICRIVHAPYSNQISINFHQKFGFKMINQQNEGNKVLGIYWRDLK